MNKVKLLVALVVVLFIGSSLAAQEELTAKQIMDKAFDVTKLAGSEAVSTMTIIDSKGRERVREIAMVTKLFDNGETEKRLLRFLSPADVKGTGLLVFVAGPEEDKTDRQHRKSQKFHGVGILLRRYDAAYPG